MPSVMPAPHRPAQSGIVNIRGNSYRDVGEEVSRDGDRGHLEDDEPATVRLGSTQEKSRRVIVGSNGDRSGDTRPLWITGLSPPDSWRSLHQPGYPQLHRVRHPEHHVWGYGRTLKVNDAGLCKRIPNPENRRAHLIVITRKGERVIAW